MDKTTKTLLAIIAAALWLNLAMPLFRPANAASDMIQTYLAAIYNGTCINRKICG
jgi:hypothetical protein